MKKTFMLLCVLALTTFHGQASDRLKDNVEDHNNKSTKRFDISYTLPGGTFRSINKKDENTDPYAKFAQFTDLPSMVKTYIFGFTELPIQLRITEISKKMGEWARENLYPDLYPHLGRAYLWMITINKHPDDEITARIDKRICANNNDLHAMQTNYSFLATRVGEDCLQKTIESKLRTREELKELYAIKSLNAQLSFQKFFTSISFRFHIKDLQIDDLRNHLYRKWRKKDIEQLSSLTRLKKLKLSGCGLDDEAVRSVASLTGLRSLNLSHNKIKNADSLCDLINLKSLRLGDNYITNVDFTSRLTNLTALDASVNPLKTTYFLQNLLKLMSLDLSDCKITDETIEPVAELTNLTYLDLARNQITPEGGQQLTSLVNLINLSIPFNQIDVATVRKWTVLKKLKVLNVYGNSDDMAQMRSPSNSDFKTSGLKSDPSRRSRKDERLERIKRLKKARKARNVRQTYQSVHIL